MSATRKAAIRTLLKGIESGDATAAQAVNEARYIQHNPQTEEGSEGLAELFARLSRTNPRVNIVRIFADGDYVFAHTEYDFAERNIGFEIFRFDGDQAVEHWDNIQRRAGPNPSGRSMVDGPATVDDPAATETTRRLVKAYTESVLIERDLDRLADFVDDRQFIQHNPSISDDLPALRSYLEATYGSEPAIRYQRNHRVLAEGNFALAVNEGYRDNVHCAFFDLYRAAGDRLVEHWDTIEAIPPRSEWKNANGKFSFPDA